MIYPPFFFIFFFIIAFERKRNKLVSCGKDFKTCALVAEKALSLSSKTPLFSESFLPRCYAKDGLLLIYPRKKDRQEKTPACPFFLSYQAFAGTTGVKMV